MLGSKNRDYKTGGRLVRIRLALFSYILNEIKYYDRKGTEVSKIAEDVVNKAEAGGSIKKLCKIQTALDNVMRRGYPEAQRKLYIADLKANMLNIHKSITDPIVRDLEEARTREIKNDENETEL